MSEFKAVSTSRGDALSVKFEGTIDEDVQFPSLNLNGHGSVELDLQNIRAINSVGIREWLNWIRPLAEQVPITLINCPKAMVFQFNMVEGFLPKRALVSSFYVPFYCEKCDREDNVLFTVGHEARLQNGNVEITFDAAEANLCKNGEGACETEMDVTESKYFQFLKKAAA